MPIVKTASRAELPFSLSSNRYGTIVADLELIHCNVWKIFFGGLSAKTNITWAKPPRMALIPKVAVRTRVPVVFAASSALFTEK